MITFLIDFLREILDYCHDPIIKEIPFR
ncbi:MAG: hypothetical protein AB8U93_07465 [Francisella endosymbiont of Hyalomma scupense]